MVMRSVRRLVLLFAVAIMLVAPMRASASQGSFDTIRVVDENGNPSLYRTWLTWPQLLLTTPDGGAWSFFTAQAGSTTAPYKLFVSRYDPTAAKWNDATPLAGGALQFGVTGVVDVNGIAHVVYTDRAADEATEFGRLMYMRTTPEGTWTAPVAVNDNPDSGHQLAPSIVADPSAGIHLIWQDQRTVSAEARAASPANAAIVGCDLTADGICAADPVAISVPATETEIGNRPKLSTDGQRLIAIWSVYASTSETDLTSASQIAWSSRPLADAAAPWSAPQTMVDRGDSAIGGRLVDLVSDPTGASVAVFGRRTEIGTSLYLTRLAADQQTWSEPMLLTAGNRGAFPSLAVGADGSVYIAYNLGTGQYVTVGGLVIPPGATGPTREVELSVSEFGSKGQPIVSVDNQGRVWVMYVFAPLYSGELEATQVPNEIHVLRAATFSTEAAPAEQLNPPVASPVPSDGAPTADATPGA